MKARLLSLPLFLLFANSSFSQEPPRHFVPAKKKDSVPPNVTGKKVIAQPKPVPASEVNAKPKEEVALVKNPNLVSGAVVNAKPKEGVAVVKNSNLTTAKPVVVTPPSNMLKAQLLDAFGQF